MEKSVLLVDDKQEIAKIIMLYLSSTYKVSYKENPLKAIAWLQEGNLPDLIISDLNMPEMSGEEFLVYLKANDMFSHIPVLILSSVESSSNRIRLFEEAFPLREKGDVCRIRRMTEDMYEKKEDQEAA